MSDFNPLDYRSDYENEGTYKTSSKYDDTYDPNPIWADLNDPDVLKGIALWRRRMNAPLVYRVR